MLFITACWVFSIKLMFARVNKYDGRTDSKLTTNQNVQARNRHLQYKDNLNFHNKSNSIKTVIK